MERVKKLHEDSESTAVEGTDGQRREDYASREEKAERKSSEKEAETGSGQQKDCRLVQRVELA